MVLQNDDESSSHGFESLRKITNYKQVPQFFQGILNQL